MKYEIVHRLESLIYPINIQLKRQQNKPITNIYL